MNVWTALFSVASFVALATPFILTGGGGESAAETDDAAAGERANQLRWALAELDVDAASGKISPADHDALRAELEEELAKCPDQDLPRKRRPGGGLSRS